MPRPAIPSRGGPRWLTSALDPDALDRYVEALGYARSGEAVEALARAISSSLRPDGRVLAVRVPRNPPARLALLVEAGEAARAEAAAQLETLTRVTGQLRFVGYSAAAAIAERLARRLERRLGDGLRSYRLTAIPRGGWLVAGLVAAHLSRSPARAHGTATGVLIVDDCALTGVAFRRFSRRFDGRRLVFAPLLAPRQLAREIERQPEVAAVEVGAELAEASGLAEPAYTAWRARWRERLVEPPYWLGQTEFPCFPWNEPQRWIWNPVSRQVEPAWRLLAGERCLDGRGAAVGEPAGPAALRLADDVVAAEVDLAVYVGDLRSAGSWRLEGVGALLWKALTSHGDRDRAVAEVVRRFAVTEEDAGRDLDRWLGELTGRGLLEGR